MTEETRTQLNEIEDEFWRSDMTTYSLDVANRSGLRVGREGWTLRKEGFFVYKAGSRNRVTRVPTLSH